MRWGHRQFGTACVCSAVLLSLVVPHMVRAAGADAGQHPSEPRTRRTTLAVQRPSPANQPAAHKASSQRPPTARSPGVGAASPANGSRPSRHPSAIAEGLLVRPATQHLGTGVVDTGVLFRAPRRAVVGGPATYDPKAAAVIGGTMMGRKRR